MFRRDPFVSTGEVDGAGTELEALGPLVESAAVLERARMLAVVEHLPSAAVDWFKGREWPDIMPVAHRSPPGTAARLVMSIDLL